ncbi:MAG: alkylglycerol monooxygenase, partial [Saprospiraceae bacterium]
MTAYAKVLLIAIPLFFVLILIEWTASWFMGKKVFTSMDTISSLSAGMTNTLKSVMGLIVTII